MSAPPVIRMSFHARVANAWIEAAAFALARWAELNMGPVTPGVRAEALRLHAMALRCEQQSRLVARMMS